MKKLIFVFLVLLLLFLVNGCVPAEKKCSRDQDCAQAACCHASEAVNKEYGPNCAGMLCTAECVPATLDCGQGELRCVSGECQVVLKE